MSYFCAPQNTSLLNPGEFRFFVHRAPYLSFFTQTVALPSINLQSVPASNPFTDLNFAGDHIDWDGLSVNFLVDEDLKGYIECYNWIRGLGFPESFEEYQAAVADQRYTNRWEALTSDVSVFTNTGSKKANIEFIFRDAKPIMVSAPTLSTTNPNLPVQTAKVLFDYTLFDVKPVNVG
jgi:hypothetical protein